MSLRYIGTYFRLSGRKFADLCLKTDFLTTGHKFFILLVQNCAQFLILYRKQNCNQNNKVWSHIAKYDIFLKKDNLGINKSRLPTNSNTYFWLSSHDSKLFKTLQPPSTWHCSYMCSRSWSYLVYSFTYIIYGHDNNNNKG